MSEHSIFYYPYASLNKEQTLLLKATALYFDKLYMLDPMKASWAAIGMRELEADLRLLEKENLLERIAPEEILHRHETTIVSAIQRDRADAGFRKLCEEKGDSRWTLALAKVPQPLRNDPAYQPMDDSMKRIMMGYTEVYDEYRESQTGPVEYRYSDYPFEVGEAIMLNHALVGSLLYKSSVPITDDPLHSRILGYKLHQVQQIPEIRALLEARAAQTKFAHAQLVTQALADIDLGVIPETMPLEQILDHRRKYAGELEAARNEFYWMARKITDEPWTKDFEEEVYHSVIPQLRDKLKPAQRSWSLWLKAAGVVAGGAAIGLGLFAEPITSISATIAGLAVAKDVGIGGLEAFRDWKEGKTQNGFHYLLRLKS